MPVVIWEQASLETHLFQVSKCLIIVVKLLALHLSFWTTPFGGQQEDVQSGTIPCQKDLAQDRMRIVNLSSHKLTLGEESI